LTWKGKGRPVLGNENEEGTEEPLHKERGFHRKKKKAHKIPEKSSDSCNGGIAKKRRKVLKDRNGRL